MSEKYGYFNHAVRGNPNNFITRWAVKKINLYMKKCESRWELRIMYRIGKSKKGQKSEYHVHKSEGGIFSLYLVLRRGYEGFRKREREYIMREHERMNSHNNLGDLRGGTYV